MLVDRKADLVSCSPRLCDPRSNANSRNDNGCYRTGDDLAYIITVLSDPSQAQDVVERAIDLLRAASCGESKGRWQALISTAGLNLRALAASLEPTSAESQGGAVVAMPVIERMGRYLMVPHAEWDDEQVSLNDFSREVASRLTTQTIHAQMKIIRAIGNLCLEDADATLLLAQQSSLIPGIIVLLYRHSAKILGVDYGSHASDRCV